MESQQNGWNQASDVKNGKKMEEILKDDKKK